VGRAEPLLLLSLILLAGCAEEDPPTITDTITVDVFTARCDPEVGFEEQFVEVGLLPTLRWEVLCVRDDARIGWLAVKVSDWDDRADDWWNVWYLDPDLREVTYGEAPLPGVADENNPFAPDALPRVAPRELTIGSYRAEVWAVSADLVDSTIGETKFTVVEVP
jgi:hypothetical protein